MILHRQNNFYRVKSGYFRSDEDVKNQAKEKLAVRFPEIPIEKEIKVEKVYTEYRYMYGLGRYIIRGGTTYDCENQNMT